jgi:hypothetical protein
MLPAVNLNNKSALSANKVDNKSSDGFLAHEFAAADSPRAQPVPKQKFGIG